MNLNLHRVWHADPRVPADVRQAFDRFLRPVRTDGSASSDSQWSPRVDIREDAHQFVILADVPGIDPAQIEVSMDKGVLSIKGERIAGDVDPASRFTRVERSRGAFHRHFALPDSADAEGISANGRFGVLEIVIPKKAQAAPRRITINH